jgi:hypothetical protein
MNCFKLVVTLLASASLLSAAAFPDPFEQFDEQVINIIHAGDNPLALAAFLGEDIQDLEFSEHSLCYFLAAAKHHRTHTFQFLLSRLTFREGRRDENLTALLKITLEYGDIELANYVMSQHFEIQRHFGRSLACAVPRNLPVPAFLDYIPPCPPRNLSAFLDFISAHKAHAADLVHVLPDFDTVWDEGDLSILISLVRHCESLSGQQLFYPTKVLQRLIYIATIPDEQFVPIALRLLQEGAEVNEKLHDLLEKIHRLHDLSQTMEIVNDWDKEEIKVTEEEADQIHQ